MQGPIAVEAASQLGLPSHIAVMTVMMGDQITNLVQPFLAATTSRNYRAACRASARLYIDYDGSGAGDLLGKSTYLYLESILFYAQTRRATYVAT